MNKLFKISLIVLSLMFLVFSFPVLAEENNITAADLNVSEPTILPNSPFYFIKNLGRTIQTALTFDPVKKTELIMKFTNEKLIEAEKISQTSTTDATDKALSNYEQEVKKLKDYAEDLKKDNPNNEKLLTKITEQIFNHQKLLDQLAEKKAEVKDRVELVKDKVAENLTTATFSLASPEKVQEKIKNIVQNQETKINDLEKALTLKKMEEKTSNGEDKKVIIKSQEDILSQKLENPNLTEEEKQKIELLIENLKTKKEYREVVIDDVLKKLATENKDLLNQRSSSLSEEDIAKLKNLAESLLTKDINYGNVIKELNNLNISPEAKKLIDNIQEKVVNQTNSQEIGCVSVDNPVCGVDNKTYANICEAKKLGVIIAYKSKCGECVAEGKIINPSMAGVSCCSGLVLCEIESSIKNNNEKVGVCKKTCDTAKKDNNKVCTLNWDPVCGENGKTYSNECFLNNAGVKISFKGECPKSEKQTQNTEGKNKTNAPTVGLANPASVYCKEQGYKVDIRKDDKGNEYGMCVFNDGKECEEWKFYRKECGDEYRK